MKLFQFIRRWWNWWHLPRFKTDDEMVEWFESVDLGSLDLPPANGVAFSPQTKIKWSHDV